MFWDSVRAGLEVLTYWETYAAALLFLAVSMGPRILVGFVAEKSGRAGGVIGCSSILVLSFFETFALVVFVLTLAPIILGLSNEAAWSFPWLLTAQAPWMMATFVGKLLLATLILAFFPLLGRFQSLHTLLLGSFALALVIGIFSTISPAVAAKTIHFWPGFLFVIGLLLLGAVMAWLGIMAVAMLSAVLEAWSEGLGQILVFPIAAVFGFIPLFIYGAWLGSQLRVG